MFKEILKGRSDGSLMLNAKFFKLRYSVVESYDRFVRGFEV